MVGVWFFTAVCDSAAAPACAALSSQVLPSRSLDEAWSVCAGVLVGGKITVFEISECLNKY